MGQQPNDKRVEGGEMKLSDKMTTLEMEIAIMDYFDVRQNMVVPNVFWSFFNHEVDLLSLTNAGYATEVEIKVSRSDLKADAKKKHNHESTLLKYLYFAVPENLAEFALEHIPERAGLFSVSRSKSHYKTPWQGEYSVNSWYVKKVKEAKRNGSARKWSNVEIHKLLRIGVMRILGLKKKILKYKEGERE